MQIGILGAGQLAMMLAQAARSLNIKTLCFTDQDNTPASHHSEIFLGNLDNPTDLKDFAKQVDIITLENEFISPEIIKTLKQIKPVYPDEKALSITQDRILEKKLFNQLNIPCAEYAEINTREQLQEHANLFNHQAILKTRTLGYDGKGQYRIKNTELPKLENYQNFILEKLVKFEFEVSIIAARNISQKTIFYPLTLNKHHDGILRTSTAPFENAHLQQQAENYAQKILTDLNYIGVIAIEFFVLNNQLYANEIAPRVHNSGHWTIEGSRTSQFENHLRAIANLHLGKTNSIPSVMYNLIGEIPNQLPQGVLHDYYKTPRDNRKVGHVTEVKN